MKKIWLLIVIFNAILLCSNAQTLRFAVFADPLVSWMKTDVSRVESDGARIGINAGLMVDRFFTDHYAFSSGISIMSMGGTLRYTTERPFRTSSGTVTLPPNTSVAYKLQYLHIPLTIKMRTTQIGYTTYYAHVGLDPMINIKANADITSQNLKNTGIGDEVNTIYMGYHIGAGMEYQIVGTTTFTTGITYTNGFTDVTNNTGIYSEKTVMHFFELRLGIIF